MKKILFVIMFLLVASVCFAEGNVTLLWDNDSTNSGLTQFIETSVEHKISNSSEWSELGSVLSGATTMNKDLGIGFKYGDSIDFRARARYNNSATAGPWSEYCATVTATLAFPVAGKPAITLIILK